MTTAIRLLIIEDSPDDAEVLVRELQRAEYDTAWQRVETARELREALAAGSWDLVISDHTLSQFGAVAALTIAKEVAPNVPFLVVSGTSGEEAAVEAMRAGACDYLLKRNPERLVSAVSRALRAAEGRKERRRVERDRGEGEERLRQLLNNMPHMVWLNDPAGCPEYINRRALEYCGVSPEEMRGWDWRQVVHEEDLPATLEAVRRRIETGEPMRVEYRLRRQDGQYRWHIGRSSPLLDEAGHVVKWVGTATDVDDLKRAESALRVSEARFRAIIEKTFDGVVLSDAAGGFSYVSPAAARILGRRPGEFAAGDGFAWVHPEDVARVAELWDELLRRPGGVANTTCRGLHPDGSWRWLETQYTNLLDDPHVGAVVVNLRDVTEQREATQRLARDALLLANVRDSVVVTDLQGVVTYWNEGATRLFGWTAGEMLGRPYADRIPDPGARAYVAGNIRALARGAEWSGEWEDYRKDGSRVWIDARVRCICDAAGRPFGILALAHDISDRKRLEEEFRQAQKMEAIGRLAGGVAHDFNNLLTIINGYSGILLADLHGHDRSRSMVEEIQKAGERAASLTGQLLAFSRKQLLQPKVLDLNALLVNVQKMLTRLIGEDVRLATIAAPHLARIKADPGQVEQMLVNLAINARDAMPQGGVLTVATANAVLDEAATKEFPEVRPGPYVLLKVSDTGCGMDRETQAHIFEPFFTTKEPGKGTGLGLSMVYGFVKSSGGHIEVHSRSRVGTTFMVYFPAVADEEPTGERQPGVADLPGGTETVLLVEDEDGVRRLAEHILGQLGYRVLAAEDGSDALRLARGQRGRIDLLLTDVVMPGMSGRQVAEHIQDLHPEAKVLYLSGYTDDATVRHGVLEAETAFLQKPFTTAALAMKVRAVLDGKG